MVVLPVLSSGPRHLLTGIAFKQVDTVDGTPASSTTGPTEPPGLVITSVTTYFIRNKSFLN